MFIGAPAKPNFLQLLTLFFENSLSSIRSWKRVGTRYKQVIPNFSISEIASEDKNLGCDINAPLIRDIEIKDLIPIV